MGPTIWTRPTNKGEEEVGRENEREGWAVAEWRRELIESWIKLSFFVPAEKTRRDSI